MGELSSLFLYLNHRHRTLAIYKSSTKIRTQAIITHPVEYFQHSCVYMRAYVLYRNTNKYTVRHRLLSFTDRYHRHESIQSNRTTIKTSQHIECIAANDRMISYPHMLNASNIYFMNIFDLVLMKVYLQHQICCHFLCLTNSTVSAVIFRVDCYFYSIVWQNVVRTNANGKSYALAFILYAVCHLRMRRKWLSKRK